LLTKIREDKQMGGKGGSSFDMNAYMQMQQQQMAQQEAMMQRMMEAMAGMMAPMEMPMPESGSASINEDYLANQEDQKRTEGISRRDELYADYLDSVDKATNYVNDQIEQERANADLLGVQYNMDDSIKNERISDYFASIWGAGQQSELEKLMTDWGNPEGFDDWLIVRGDASKVDPEQSGLKEVQGATNRQTTLPSLTDEDDDDLGLTSTSKSKSSNVLGL
jgi:hypothetical protein